MLHAEMLEIRQELQQFLNDQAGTMMASLIGIELWKNRLAEHFAANGADPSKFLLLGRGNPNEREALGFQRWRIGEIPGHLSESGFVAKSIGWQWAVSTFAYWEHHIRPGLAKAASQKPSQIEVPIFGDLRLIRNDILHNKGFAAECSNRCELLHWFNEGEEILISSEHLIDFMKHAGMTFRP